MTTKHKFINVSRNDVLAAIFTEPLGAVSPGWITGDAKPKDAECKVCAVGAVMRYIGKTRPATGLLKRSNDKFGDICATNTYGKWANFHRDESTINPHLKELSDTYEDLADTNCVTNRPKHSLRAIRNKLADLVIKTFPQTLTIQVRG